MELKDRIKTARESANLNQTELACKLGITPVAICNWENGRRTPRNKETFLKIAEATSADFEWLMYGLTKNIAGVPQVTMAEETKKEEPKAEEPKEEKPKYKDVLVYKAVDGDRLDAINLCIRHIREMNISQKEMIQIHKALTYFRENMERTILFGE